MLLNIDKKLPVSRLSLSSIEQQRRTSIGTATGDSVRDCIFVFERVSPYRERVSPYRERVSPYRERVSPYRERVSPYRERVSPYREHVFV